MRIFAPVYAAFERLLALMSGLIVALDGIRARLDAIHGSIDRFDLQARDALDTTDDPRIVALSARMGDLTNAVADGIQRVQRSENRVRAIVQGARKQLEEHGFEHAGVNAEAEEIRELDGGDGAAERLPEVPADVEDDRDGPSSIPGVTRGDMRRAFQRLAGI